MEIQTSDLFTQPQHIPLVARWIYDEFWADKDVLTPKSLAELLKLAIQPDQIPLSLLALVDRQPVGTINLIENDDHQRTHLRPWLAALYVVPEHRHRGIGSALVRSLFQRAVQMDINELYLGTDNPGFYVRLGAVIHEQVADDFCIMRLASAIT